MKIEIFLIIYYFSVKKKKIIILLILHFAYCFPLDFASCCPLGEIYFHFILAKTFNKQFFCECV